MKVLYWGVHDPSYPRNARIRAFLEQRFDAEVVIVSKPKEGSRFARVLSLLPPVWRIRRNDYSLVILSEFSLQYAMSGRLAAYRARAPFVVDFFVGLEETEIGDFSPHASRSIRARILRAADRYAVASASIVLTDTSARAESFGKQFNTQFVPLPVGAPDWSRSRGPSHRDIDLLYYGSYLPLHNTDLIVSAIAQPECSIQRALFVGTGPGRSATERLAVNLGVSDRIEFLNDVPPERIGEYLSRSKVVVGVFGDSRKARGVIANKVWQGLYAGARVVTRDSPALDEIRDLAGDYLVAVEDLTPVGIAKAIAKGIAVVPGLPVPTQSLDGYVSSRYLDFERRLLKELSRAPRA